MLSGKHVFVEKPLALRPEEIVAIEETIRSITTLGEPTPTLMVGFNRRFAPHDESKGWTLDTQELQAIVPAESGRVFINGSSK